MYVVPPCEFLTKADLPRATCDVIIGGHTRRHLPPNTLAPPGAAILARSLSATDNGVEGKLRSMEKIQYETFVPALGHRLLAVSPFATPIQWTGINYWYELTVSRNFWHVNTEALGKADI